MVFLGQPRCHPWQVMLMVILTSGGSFNLSPIPCLPGDPHLFVLMGSFGYRAMKERFISTAPPGS